MPVRKFLREKNIQPLVGFKFFNDEFIEPAVRHDLFVDPLRRT